MSSKQSGLVMLYKPSGSTSFQALGSIKKKLKHGKVGHTGTLDKFAEGLLIVLAGKNTRLVPFFEGLDKSYLASIRFGAVTETLDTESPEIEKCAVPDFDEIEAQLEHFMGTQEQVPPQYSAVHINGTRAYKRKMQGEEVDIPSRSITVHNFEIRDWTAPVLKLEIHCSKGTYIRALARDIGEAAGSRAYLQALKRTRIGPFRVEDSVLPEDFRVEEHLESVTPALLQLPGIVEKTIPESLVEKVLHGTPIQSDRFFKEDVQEGLYALMNPRQELCALAELHNNQWKYRYVAERN